jgi:hypothetical protein
VFVVQASSLSTSAWFWPLVGVAGFLALSILVGLATAAILGRISPKHLIGGEPGDEPNASYREGTLPPTRAR